MTNNVKNIIVSSLAAIVVVVLILWMRDSSRSLGTASTQGSTPIPTQISGGSQPSVANALEATESFISDGNFYMLGTQFNGGVTAATSVQRKTIKQTIVSGTSTPCSILNPFSATSTVSDVSMNISTATSSTIQWVVGTSTTQYATSSNIATQVVFANAEATIASQPSNVIAASGNYVLFGPGAATAVGTNAFTSIIFAGTCQATFQTAN